MNFPKINELIAYRKRREPALGIVLKAYPEKLSIFSEDGKRYDIEPKKIAFLTGISIHETLTDSEKKLEMRRWRRDLEREKDSMDLETVWQCVVEETDTVVFEEVLDLYFGTNQVSSEQRFRLFWSLDKNTIYFARDENGYLVRSREDVFGTLQAIEQREKKERETLEAVNWVRRVLSGEVPAVVDKNHVEFLELIERYVIYLDSYERAKEAKSFLYDAGLKDAESAVEFLIKTSFWEKDDDTESKKIAFHFKQSKKALEETRAIMSARENFDELTDRTNLEVFSVDSETTEDIDDSISFETHDDQITLGVHISNVTHWVDRGCFLDKEAFERGETVYFPEKSIDMFPQEIVSEKLSLTAGRIRPALSLFAVFSKEDFSLIDYRFETTVIKVSENLTYAEASDIFLGETWGEKLLSLTDSLRRRRIDKGAFIVQLPELRISVKERGEISMQKNYMNSPAHKVVSECMILMNRLSGEFFRGNEIPALFRSQPQEIEPEAKNLDSQEILFPSKVLKYLKPSLVILTPEVHKSLGVDCYVQMTSPIRRYTDLLMQRQIISWLKDRKIYYGAAELEDINTRVSLFTREIKNAQKSRHRYWLIRYLMEKGIESSRGYITSRGYNGFNVYIPEFLIELPLSNVGGKTFKTGEEISVSLWGLDPLRRTIRVTPV